MPFINKRQAFSLLNSIEGGKSAGSCRKVWMRNLKYALETKTNPLKLTTAERRRMTRKIASLRGRRATRKN